MDVEKIAVRLKEPHYRGIQSSLAKKRNVTRQWIEVAVLRRDEEVMKELNAMMDRRDRETIAVISKHANRRKAS